MHREALLLDVDYKQRDNEMVVRVFCKTEGGKNIVAIDKNFSPYFYVLPEPQKIADLRKKMENHQFKDSIEIKRLEQETKLINSEEREVLKVFTEHPPDLNKIKDEIKSWPEVKGKREFDITFYKRYMIDNNLYPMSWIEIEGDKIDKSSKNVEYLNVEKINSYNGSKTAENLNFIAFDLETFEEEVIMASFYGNGFKKVISTKGFEGEQKYAEIVRNEKELIKRLIEIIQSEEVDLLLGYNTDDFDFEVLRERAQTHGLELELGRDNSRMIFKRRGRTSSAKITGRLHIDLFRYVENIMSRYLKSETLSLEKVATEVLGEGKADMKWQDIKQAWEEEKDLYDLVRYSLKDARLTYDLGKEILPQIFSLSRLSGLTSFDASRLTYGQIVENYLIREAFKDNRIVPNRPKRSLIQKRRGQDPYAGGFVIEPEKGLHENLAMLDYRSLYPSVIVSFNISPEILEKEDCDDGYKVPDLGYNFCQDEPGFIPKILKRLVEERYEIKQKLRKGVGSQNRSSLKSRSYAIKILSNSFYGYMGYSGARWYSKECARSVTKIGRDYIHKTIKTAEEMDFNVIYGDTDSVLLQAEDIKERANKFRDKVNTDLPEFMELELEDFYERGLFTYTKKGKGAKKKYALMNEEGKIKIMGFEQVRRDWSELAKNLQEEVIKTVLNGNVSEAEKAVRETINRLKEGDVDMDDLVIYSKLNKPPSEYDTTSPHVEAAIRADRRGLNIEPGQTLGFVITDKSGKISDKAEILKFAEDYDSDYYIKNQVLPAAMRVLKVLNYKEDDFLLKGKQSGIDQFAN